VRKFRFEQLRNLTISLTVIALIKQIMKNPSSLGLQTYTTYTHQLHLEVAPLSQFLNNGTQVRLLQKRCVCVCVVCVCVVCVCMCGVCVVCVCGVCVYVCCVYVCCVYVCMVCVCVVCVCVCVVCTCVWCVCGVYVCVVWGVFFFVLAC
jgi:hypothetical protein